MYELITCRIASSSGDIDRSRGSPGRVATEPELPSSPPGSSALRQPGLRIRRSLLESWLAPWAGAQGRRLWLTPQSAEPRGELGRDRGGPGHVAVRHKSRSACVCREHGFRIGWLRCERRSGRPSRSGRRGSNPRPSAWEADALPTELRPRCLYPSRVGSERRGSWGRLQERLQEPGFGCCPEAGTLYRSLD